MQKLISSLVCLKPSVTFVVIMMQPTLDIEDSPGLVPKYLLIFFYFSSSPSLLLLAPMLSRVLKTEVLGPVEMEFSASFQTCLPLLDLCSSLFHLAILIIKSQYVCIPHLGSCFSFYCFFNKMPVFSCLQ